MRAVILASVMMLSVSAKAQSIHNMWRARGLEALDKLQNKTTPPRPAERICAVALEWAYAMHVGDTDKLVFKEDKDIEIYHLYIGEKVDDKTTAADLVFAYKKAAPSAPLLVRLDRLDSPWKVLWLTPGMITLSSPSGCNYVINQNNGLDSAYTHD